MTAGVNSGGHRNRRADGATRPAEVIAVVLLGIATVASAWCAYQASQWTDVETASSRTATDERIEQARLFSRGTQVGSYDTAVLIAYASALADDRTELGDFIRSTLMRDEFIPVLEQWQQQVDAGDEDLTSLLDNTAYSMALFTEAADAEARAQLAQQEATDAGGYADRYLMTTLFMASALFFAGVVSTMRSRSLQVVLLTGSFLTLVFGASRIVQLPVA